MVFLFYEWGWVPTVTYFILQLNPLFHILIFSDLDTDTDEDENVGACAPQKEERFKVV